MVTFRQAADRDMKTEAALSAAAEANERAVLERDAHVRKLASENGIPGFLGNEPLSSAALTRCMCSSRAAKRDAHVRKLASENSFLGVSFLRSTHQVSVLVWSCQA